jgi:hypothetical protein
MSLRFHDFHSKRRFIRGIVSTSAIILLSLGVCGADTSPSPPAETSNSESITTETVDCLLPNQLRSMGDDMPTLAPRRNVKISPKECQERGGEVVSGKSTQ